MKYIGILLYVFWLLLLLHRYARTPKEGPFSYRKTFFGGLTWYRNIRNLILIIALFIIELFLPLKLLYLLFLITSVVILAICINNLRMRIGSLLPTLFVFFIGIGMLSLASVFVFNL
ncbi:hypothetical protein [Liquorilactobacillus capillatus]|uniref:Uncharacterized protein n=1 Tax=Liquorilactobacillus capillatus DSM 19910 TaxID=1423731 RepID=A0A0R1M071_9LACO|nr:hypothetical protein [Liquorilactobacillus capillatus]KRL01278.1 hypothetical protein FC81_GL001419 [Liquorilactobacillus capillatus DSM 19910]